MLYHLIIRLPKIIEIYVLQLTANSMKTILNLVVYIVSLKFPTLHNYLHMFIFFLQKLLSVLNILIILVLLEILIKAS